MPYREKTAILYLSGMLLCFGAYFLYVAFNPSFYDLPILGKIGILAPLAVANMIIVGIGHLWLFKTHSAIERKANDERDDEIDAKASRAAYHTLIYCALFVGGFLPFYSQPWEIVNCTMFIVVISETIRGIIVIKNYRKQAV